MTDKKLNFHAIALAAGLSSRMGESNKLLLEYNRHSILEEVMTQLVEADLSSVAVVLGYEKEKTMAILETYPVQFIENPNYREGQSSSIQAGVNQLPEGCDAFLVCLGDMPLLSSKHYNLLLDQYRLNFHPRLILRPFQNNRPGHPVIFHRSYQQEILQSPEEDGCRTIIQKNAEQLVRFETSDPAYFQDIDTREEYVGLKT